MFRKIILLLISIACLLLLPTQAASQELFFSSLTGEVQLPSQECYQILQDKSGYIWFSTDNGLCRYGSNKLLVFDKSNGLPEENVYAMTEDKQGKLWFATSKNRILYFENGQLKEAPFNKDYQAFEQKILANPIPHDLDMNDPEHSIISNSYYTVRINQNKKKDISKIPRTNQDAFYLKKKRTGFPFLPIGGFHRNKFSEKLTILLKNETQQLKIYLPELNNKYAHWLTPTALAENVDFIGVQNQLVRVNADFTYTKLSFPDRILKLYTDKSNGLWVGVLNNGVYYYPDVKTMKLGHHSLRKYSVTGICEDHERGIWCTTLEKGLQYSRNKFILTYSATEGLDRNITLLKYHQGHLYVSSFGNQLFVKNPGETQFTSHTLPIEKENFYSDILDHGNYWILSSKVIMVRTDRQFRSVKRLYSINGSAAANKLVKHRNQLFGGLVGFLYRIQDPEKVVELIRNKLPFRTKCILFFEKEQLLLGADQGLFKYDLTTKKHTQIKGIPEKVTGLLKSRTGRIWIITADDDIYWMDGSKVTAAGKKLNLKKSTLHDITEDQYGTIWVASNEGLYRFKKQGTNYTTSHYSIHNGLPSNEVYKVAADNESIWFSTFEGLFSIPLQTEAGNKIGPPIHLQKLLINNRISNQSQPMKLAFDQNNFRFTFDILTFKNGPVNKLIYVLSNGSKNTSVEVNSNEIFLENLSPGSYKLTVYGMNNDGVRSSEPEVFRIIIEKPFWLAWWFISITVILFAFVILLIVRLIVKNIRKAEEAKTLVNKMMAEYQITALQAQMNPHFIFNAINTIQGYILGKNEAEAYSYLAKFSKLIRMVLHHSQAKVLPLERELEVLRLYIELEQLRFDNCFDYELLVAEGTEITDFNIPGMLLQPYVENAIWHGIVNLENSRRGKLILSIENRADQLIITITDNGVGREKAQSFHWNANHKSVGLQLTGERLDVLNKLHGENAASVKITDVLDKEGMISGTRVEISIPITI